MPQNKNPIQARIEEEKQKSGITELTQQQIAQRVGELARREGVQRDDVRKQISESIKNSDNYKIGIQNRDQSFRNDPEYQKAHKQRMQELRNNSQFIEAQRQGREALRNDPERWSEYQKNHTKGNQAKFNDPKFWENYYAGIKRRESDKSYHKSRIEKANAVICRRVRTPLGDFDSITLAAGAHGMSNTETMRNRLKSANFPDYYFLDDNVRPKTKK